MRFLGPHDAFKLVAISVTIDCTMSTDLWVPCSPADSCKNCTKMVKGTNFVQMKPISFY